MGIDRATIPWYPVIDDQECTGCGACMEFCANDIFELSDGIMKVKNPLNCVVGCDKCASECQTSALSFPSKESLVAWIREARRTTGSF